MDLQNILNKAIKELKEDQVLPPEIQNIVNTYSPESAKPLQGTATTPQEIWSGMKETGAGLASNLQAGAQTVKDSIRNFDATVRDFGEKKLQPAMDTMSAQVQQTYDQNIAPTVEKGAGYLKQFVTDPGQYFKDLGSNLKAFGQEQLDKTFPNGFPVKLSVGGKDVTPIVGSPMTKFFNRAEQDWHNSEGILDFIKNRPDLAAGAGIPAALLAGAGALALRRRQRAAQSK